MELSWADRLVIRVPEMGLSWADRLVTGEFPNWSCPGRIAQYKSFPQGVNPVDTLFRRLGVPTPISLNDGLSFNNNNKINIVYHREFLELDAELPKANSTAALSNKNIMKIISKVIKLDHFYSDFNLYLNPLVLFFCFIFLFVKIGNKT